MRKTVSLAISLSALIGCSSLPEFPDVYQCAWAGEPRAFYCVHNRTKERIKVPAMAPEMNGAQCLSLHDYKRVETWAELVKALAEKRCK